MFGNTILGRLQRRSRGGNAVADLGDACPPPAIFNLGYNIIFKTTQMKNYCITGSQGWERM